MRIRDIVITLLVSAAILFAGGLLFACDSGSSSKVKVPEQPIHLCQDPEPNDTLKKAIPLGPFYLGDVERYCGNTDSLDPDTFWHFAPEDFNLDLYIEHTEDAFIIASIYVTNAAGTTRRLEAIFVGTWGGLKVTDFPIDVDDFGFYLQLTTPFSDVFQYDVELWND